MFEAVLGGTCHEKSLGKLLHESLEDFQDQILKKCQREILDGTPGKYMEKYLLERTSGEIATKKIANKILASKNL